VHTTGDPKLLSAALRATWPDGVCTDTGIYFQPSVEIPMLQAYTRGVRFATGRVSARAVIPQILELLAGGCDLLPIVERVVPWEDAPSAWPAMTGKTVFSRL
jgi:threonine dehydrogenase-like Zn-dependent dehydrogenase